MPEAVIGDFDSLTPAMRARLPETSLFPVPEQDTTDFDKALRSISAPLVLGAGFLGDRVDHQLAAFNVLVQPDRCPCILIGASQLVFHLRRETRLPVEAGDTVSLFPMQPVTARSQGLEWPLEGLRMSPAGQIGTSNRALGPAAVSPDGPGLLCMIPRRHLAALMPEVAQAPL
jgi:thiamine pyrophosphokinase